ncbi:hypothetical protein Asppvi_005400 [Aspergillus pseudoviridinutans]|uniref:Uncharacterized protein n=1 Tax=Aspergillus pseudoviridinutans TaxID=1517512 RepID=A0A9P3BF05_9EURO|nr:uncharacterized protein Asppvi_005400 [Aspergillus pseudoviridinutans]GIJ86511.1 hypothetical protein Asppvi_005400 [Aspergillus pseudoviridinutans]
MGETIYESSKVEAKIDGSPMDADELRLAQMGVKVNPLPGWSPTVELIAVPMTHGAPKKQ